MTRPVDHLERLGSGDLVELLGSLTPAELAEQRAWFVAEMARTDEGDGVYRSASYRSYRRGRHVAPCDEFAERRHNATGRSDDI